MCQYSPLWKVNLQIFIDPEGIRVQKWQLTFQTFEVVDGVVSWDQVEVVEKIDQIWRRKRKSPRTETEIS